MVTKRAKHFDLTSLVVSKLLLSFFSNSIIKYGFILFFDEDRYFNTFVPKTVNIYVVCVCGGGGEQAPSDNFENIDGQIVHSDAI